MGERRARLLHGDSMKHADIDRLRSIKTFPSLVKYLRDDLGWQAMAGEKATLVCWMEVA